MAHNININLGKASFYSARVLPWHNLGQITKEAKTSKEAIELAGLDFTVDKLKLTYEFYKNSPIPRIGNVERFATVRMDNGNYLGGIVSKDYQIIQNVEAFDFLDSLITDGELTYETAGALGNGETIFISCKLPGEILVGKDNIDKYLLLTLSHDGKSSAQMMFTPIRVVCNNTLSMALNSTKNKISIRHSSNYKDKLDEAKKVLVKSNEAFEQYQERFDYLAKMQLSETQVKKSLANIVLSKEELKMIADGNKFSNVVSTRKTNMLTDMMKSYNEGIGQDNILGTAWGVVNGLTNYYQNVKTYNDSEQQFKKVFDNNPVITDAFAYFLQPNLVI
jgi:phage/plasmid-like protein (TIGR03299 family)